MIFSPTPLQGCFEINLTLFTDNRGWFGRYFCTEEFKKIGHNKEWLQMNHSFTEKVASIRGMHFQKPPFQEIKLVRCIKGAIFDVVIDLRLDSPTFLNHYEIELSGENKKMVYIPEGFAHGFQTLTENCELLYHHSALYHSDSESGIRYDDPMVGISWPLPAKVISKRDLGYEFLDKNFKGF